MAAKFGNDDLIPSSWSFQVWGSKQFIHFHVSRLELANFLPLCERQVKNIISEDRKQLLYVRAVVGVLFSCVCWDYRSKTTVSFPNGFLTAISIIIILLLSQAV